MDTDDESSARTVERTLVVPVAREKEAEDAAVEIWVEVCPTVEISSVLMDDIAID